MYSHVTLGTNDIEASKKFYDAILGTLGYPEGVFNDKGMCMYATPTGALGLTKPINGEPACHGNGMTIGLAVSSPELVHKWHQAGIENGGITCEDPPGERDFGGTRLYLAYLRDPAGNKLCATHFL
ncbi:VOC family protein [Pseudocolwellia sp. AS88]|jgi:catechol 2,3-dioxygenase-like lactoylglutathione lyase family enzyme|uniref:VOC family protein n=1 Tax=Pseudocolwellia TaxID=2848177 RepID=UPI0026F21EBF|nr:VOC family protein [Pseudocolwellia sp. AS88]MDO7085598.1 VOC family protein [Pseudocolwellia sp. AS88]